MIVDSLLHSNLKVHDMYIQPIAYRHAFVWNCGKRCGLLPFWIHNLLERLSDCVTYGLTSQPRSQLSKDGGGRTTRRMGVTATPK